MWSFNGITFVWCFLLVSATLASPAGKIENETDAQKPDPIVIDVIEMAADEKPTDNSKPSEIAVDPKPIEIKPTEQTKPSDSSTAPATATILETIPLNVGPPRRQYLYDQRQDGKYNIRADLENFVILVVPSSGNSLLDLLKRSGQRQPPHHKRTHHTKHHKKYHAGSSSGKPVEVKKVTNRLDYLNEGESNSSGEFIEGRTPYHVDIQSDEILQPAAYAAPNGVRSLNGNSPNVDQLTNADWDAIKASSSLPLSPSATSDSTIILSTVSGNQAQQPSNLPTMPSPTTSNTESSPRLSKAIIIGGYGIPFSNLNTVSLTPKTAYGNDQQHDNLRKNYNTYFSRKHSVQIVDKNVGDNVNSNYVNDVLDSTSHLINSPSTELLTDSQNSFNSLNVGNIDRLALAGDSTTKLDANVANAKWELTLLGAEEQCGPDRRRDSYGVCQFVPADYATT